MREFLSGILINMSNNESVYSLIFIVVMFFIYTPIVIHFAKKNPIQRKVYRNLREGDEFLIRRYLTLQDPREFEIFIGDLFKLLGYESEVTQESSDGGKDVVLEKDDETIYVECKRYNRDNTIGREMIQKLLGACVQNGVTKCYFINTGQYNNNAIQCAEETNRNGLVDIELMDTNDIVNLCLQTDSGKVLQLLGCETDYYEHKEEKEKKQGFITNLFNK